MPTASDRPDGHDMAWLEAALQSAIEPKHAALPLYLAAIGGPPKREKFTAAPPGNGLPGGAEHLARDADPETSVYYGPHFLNPKA